MRGTETARPVQLLVVGVHGDDPSRTHQSGTGDRGVAHPAAADDRHGVVTVDRAGVDRRADAGHHPASQQAGYRRVGSRIDLGALTLMHQCLVGERADAQCRSQCGAVGQCHRLLGVERVEAQMRATALARPALPAHRTPVQDHEIAGLDVGHTRADGFDRARGLMTEQERELVVDPALAIRQVGMADPAGDTSTTTSPGPGSGMTTSTNSTGSPFFREITPRTV